MTDLEPIFATIAVDQAGAQNQFNKVIKAALIKSYEFLNAAVEMQDDHVFFVMPFLRGVCEDYIALKFIASNLGSDSDQVIELKLQDELYTSAIAQWNFYGTYRPNQILYYQANFPDIQTEVRRDLRQICKVHGINLSKNQYFPNVRYMAERSDLLELYKYVYHATSSLVHFSPRILSRMGWGDLPDITFSVKHFSQYYKHFICFYGAYLLVQLSQWAIGIDLVTPAIQSHIQSLHTILTEQARWPELVTFEEMNIGGDSRVHRFHSPASNATAHQNDPV